MSDNLQDLSCNFIKVVDPNNFESEWRKLEEKCSPVYFLTWEWIGIWANIIKGNADLYLFSASRGNTTVALCFLSIYEASRLYGLIKSKQVMLNEYLANEFNMVSKYNGLLADKNDLEPAWASLSNTLLNWDKKWDEIAINSASMRSIEAISKANPELKLNIDKIESIWRLPINTRYSDINNLLGNFRAKTRKRLQQAISVIERKHGKITLSSAKSTDEALKYFQNMEVLHTERWEREGKRGSYANNNWVKFHTNLIQNNYNKGSILFVCINAGTLNIGYIYAHIYKNTAYIQQTGFLRTKDRSFMAGYVSHCYTMAHCAAIGIQNYDFLPDNKKSYKSFFTERGNPIYYTRFQKPKLKFFLEYIIRYLQSNNASN